MEIIDARRICVHIDLWLAWAYLRHHIYAVGLSPIAPAANVVIGTASPQNTQGY